MVALLIAIPIELFKLHRRKHYAHVDWNRGSAHLRSAYSRRYHRQPIPQSARQLLPDGRSLPIRPSDPRLRPKRSVAPPAPRAVPKPSLSDAAGKHLPSLSLFASRGTPMDVTNPP